MMVREFLLSRNHAFGLHGHDISKITDHSLVLKKPDRYHMQQGLFAGCVPMQSEVI